MKPVDKILKLSFSHFSQSLSPIITKSLQNLPRDSLALAANSEQKKTPLEIESEKISKILPDDLYKDVAKIIGLDENIKEKLALSKRKGYKRLYKGMRHIPKAMQSTTQDKESTEEYNSNSDYVEPPSSRKPTAANPYYDFLQKSEREQVRWQSKYLPPETEQEKGLVKRADDITNKICAEFCNYMDSLGGYESPLFKPEVVKELFQIEFATHAAKSIKIVPQEMNALPEDVAKFVVFPEISYRKTLTRQIQRDIKAENKPRNDVGFNKYLTKSQQWKPPRNNTKKQWANTEHHPKNITTMENVWNGITNLKSVQGFCKWIVDHQNEKYPKYLNKKGMFDLQKLEKMCKKDQYDHENILPQIDVPKEITDEHHERKASITTDELKILNV